MVTQAKPHKLTPEAELFQRMHESAYDSLFLPIRIEVRRDRLVHALSGGSNEYVLDWSGRWRIQINEGADYFTALAMFREMHDQGGLRKLWPVIEEIAEHRAARIRTIHRDFNRESDKLKFVARYRMRQGFHMDSPKPLWRRRLAIAPAKYALKSPDERLTCEPEPEDVMIETA